MSLLLPVAVGAGCVVLARMLDGIRAGFLGNALVACSPALAFALALFLLGWLRYPPTLTHEWLPYIGLGAALVYALIASLPPDGWWAWLVPLQVGALASWFLLPDWPYSLFVKERPFWFLFFPQMVLLAWHLSVRIGAGSEGAGPLLPMLTWGGAVVSLLLLSANARLAQMACMIVAAQVGAGALTVFRGFRARWYHSCPAASVLLLSLLLQGYLFSREWEEWSPHDIPRIGFLLLFLAPLASSILEIPGWKRVSPLPKRLSQALLVALLAGTGLYLPCPPSPCLFRLFIAWPIGARSQELPPSKFVAQIARTPPRAMNPQRPKTTPTKNPAFSPFSVRPSKNSLHEPPHPLFLLLPDQPREPCSVYSWLLTPGSWLPPDRAGGVGGCSSGTRGRRLAHALPEPMPAADW